MTKIAYWREIVGAGPDDPLELPRMTTAERDLHAVQPGYLIFNMDTSTVQVWTTSGWIDVTNNVIVNRIWVPREANFVGVAGARYMVDTSAGEVTMTLPTSPVVGTEIEFVDLKQTFATHNFIIDPNGQPFLSQATTFIADVPIQANVIFLGGTVGWSI